MGWQRGGLNITWIFVDLVLKQNSYLFQNWESMCQIVTKGSSLGTLISLQN